MIEVYALKYRGFSKEKNKWLYGYRVKNDHKTYIADSNPLEVIHITDDTALVKFSVVDSDSLGLYACSQDATDCDMYTGDVFRVMWPGEPLSEEVYVVDFDCNGFYGKGIKEKLSNEMFRYSVIIGNIYQNPQYAVLLEDEYEQELTDEEIENLEALLEAEKEGCYTIEKY